MNPLTPAPPPIGEGEEVTQADQSASALCRSLPRVGRGRRPINLRVLFSAPFPFRGKGRG